VVDPDENLYLLLIFSPVDMVIFNPYRLKKVLDKRCKTLMFRPFVFEYQIVGKALFEQGYGDGVLLVEMLLEKQGSERLLYALELGIEGTVVEADLFDDGRTLDVVVVCLKLKIKDFDVPLLTLWDKSHEPAAEANSVLT
jgi:hypothetical protein